MKDLTTRLENQLRAALSDFVGTMEGAEEVLRTKIATIHREFAEAAEERSRWMDGQLSAFISPGPGPSAPSPDLLIEVASQMRTAVLSVLESP